MKLCDELNLISIETVETKPSETPQATLDESRLENFDVKHVLKIQC